MKVELGTLKEKGEDLVAFLEPRVGTKPTLSSDSLEIEDDAIRQGVKPRHVKTYVKRFLYMNGMREKYRVFVAGKELTIQEVVLGEEEKEEKEKKSSKLAQAEKRAKEKEAAPAKGPEAEEPSEEQEEKPAKEEKPKPSKKKTKPKKEEKKPKSDDSEEPES